MWNIRLTIWTRLMKSCLLPSSSRNHAKQHNNFTNTVNIKFIEKVSVLFLFFHKRCADISGSSLPSLTVWNRKVNNRIVYLR